MLLVGTDYFKAQVGRFHFLRLPLTLPVVPATACWGAAVTAAATPTWQEVHDAYDSVLTSSVLCCWVAFGRQKQHGGLLLT
jgi:hypothetical protein